MKNCAETLYSSGCYSGNDLGVIPSQCLYAKSASANQHVSISLHSFPEHKLIMMDMKGINIIQINEV